MALKLLLDTNAYSALARGHREVASRVRDASEIVFSAVVAAELLYGFRLGRRQEENTARLEAFLRAPGVRLQPISLATAERFARVAAVLRSKGKPIPTNDLWIAAQAFETGADLLSSDAHFGHIEALPWISFSPTDEETIRERVHRYHAEASAGSD